MLYRCSILFFLLCSSIAAKPSSQQQQAIEPNSVPTFKAKTRLVLVDVVATNGKGEPVSGLKKEDFEALEDGKPQVISTFEEHKGTPPTQIQLPPMPPNVYTNFPLVQTAESVNIILLDSLNTPTSDQVYVHSQMIKYLKTIPPRTHVAIFTLASRLRMLQGITTDSSLLLAAINKTKAGPAPSPLRASTVESDADQSRIDFLTKEAQGSASNQTLAQAAVDPINATRQFLNDTALFQTDSRMSMTLEAMQQLARYLADLPGRKNVIWLSGSFPAGIVPDSNLADPFSGAANFQEEIRKTTNLLTTAQISLYPIAAEGLTSDTAFQVNNREISEQRGSLSMQDTMQQSRKASIDLDFSHASMEQLAKDTGGQAMYNTNGLNDALTRVVNNGSHYYSLTYSPTNTNMNGKYRHIQVKLVNRNENLAYRHGYYADDAQTASGSGQKPIDPLMQLMGRNLPDYTQILYKVLVQLTTPQPAPDSPRAGSNADLKGPITRYGVDFAVSVDDLRIEPRTDGTRQGNIEVMLIAYNPEGEPLNLVLSRSEIRIPSKDYANVQRGGLQIHKEIDVPPGDIYLRTGIYDLKSASTGTLGIPLSRITATASK